MPLNSMHAVFRQEGELMAYTPAPAARIYAGSLVCVDTATGLVVAGSDTAARVFVGVAHEGIVPGASTVRVWKRGAFVFPVASPAQSMVGKTAFLADDGTVSTVATTQNIPVGVVCGLENGQVRVRIDGAVR